MLLTMKGRTKASVTDEEQEQDITSATAALIMGDDL